MGRAVLSVRLTRSGVALLAMLVVLGVVAANPGLNLLLLLFGLGVALLLFNAIVCKRQVGAVRVRRMLPDVAAAGRVSVVRYEVKNVSRWMAVRGLWLTDIPGEGQCKSAVLVSYIDVIGPGSSVVVEAPMVPLRRGMLELRRLRIASKFPFGLVMRVRRVDRAESLLVWPELWMPRRDWLAGGHQRARMGMSGEGAWRPGMDEFFGIREYRPGDNTRWIHWRRSASFDRVMVREMAQTNPGRITLAIETVTAKQPVDARMLDRLVSGAASLACDALERGWHVGLIVNGRPRVVLPPTGGRAVRGRLLYELATLGAGRGPRLVDLLDRWPAGAKWEGRAVLLHCAEVEEDAETREAAARLGREIGSVVLLGPKEVEEWFDRSAPGGGGADIMATRVTGAVGQPRAAMTGASGRKGLPE